MVRRNELPDLCFSRLRNTGEIIIIKQGERGYYRSEWNTSDPAENKRLVDYLNRRSGVNVAQCMAMECGSIAGWSVPGADPQLYFNEADSCGEVPIRGHLKVPTMGILTPCSCSLLQFRIAGSIQAYLPMEAVPKWLLENCGDLVLLPDLVQGLPYLPVHAEWSGNGTCTVYLEEGCYQFGREINQGYRIITKLQVGNVEAVIGEHPSAPSRYVTWERNTANDKDGPPNYFWGHYVSTYAAAAQDFCERVFEEYQHTSRPHRQPQPDRGKPVDMER